MNEMFVAARRRDERLEGIAAQLTGRARQESAGTLGSLMAECERALQAGDDEAAARVEQEIDRRLDEARAGREQGRDPATGQFVADQPPPSFDGGVMGRRPPPGPSGMVAETSGQLLARSLQTFAAERREDGGRQIGNFVLNTEA
jgi:hypothetical protein